MIAALKFSCRIIGATLGIVSTVLGIIAALFNELGGE
jgi:hypothetical protein